MLKGFKLSCILLTLPVVKAVVTALNKLEPSVPNLISLLSKFPKFAFKPKESKFGFDIFSLK